jgi:vitamin B12 transporter
MAFWRWARRGLGPAFGVASLAWGQSSSAPEVLAPVTVPLPPAPPAPESPSVREPTGQTSVVELSGRRGEVLSTGALLSEVPGALVTSAGGLGQSESISLRGAASTGVLVLLDGIPLNGTGDIADLSLVPLSILERAEVLRGSASARYGALATGGVVNLVSRSASDTPAAFADVSGGSFGSWRASVGEVGPALGGNGLFVLHWAHSVGDFSYVYAPLSGEAPGAGETFQRTNNQATSGGALLKEAWDVAGWALDGLLEGNVLSRGLAGTEDNPTANAEQTSTRVLASLQTQHTFSNGAALLLRLDARRTTDDFTGAGFGPGQSNRLFQVGSTADVSVAVGPHALDATATLGVASVSAQAGSPTWLLSSLALQDEWLLFAGRMSLVPAVRVDQTGPFAAVSPKLGASFALPLGFSVRANVGYGFRPPSFSELYLPTGTLGVNPNLQPERSFSVDGAVLYTQPWGFFSVDGFWTRYQDLITYEYTPPFFAKPFNVSAADAWGLESEAHLRPWPWLEASGAYTLQWTKDVRDVAPYFGRELPYRPRQLGSGRLAVGPAWLLTHLDVEGRSTVTVNRAGSLSLPGHVFVGAGLDVLLWSRGPRLTASLQVKNLFDVQGQDLDGYPLPGRSFFVTLALSLGETRKRQIPKEVEAPR